MTPPRTLPDPAHSVSPLGGIWHPGNPTQMDKVAYAKYIEGEKVKGRFKMGQLVTIASAVYTPDKPPSVIFVIDHFVEIHFHVHYDSDTKEPRCIGIKHRQASGIIYYPPGKLRPLNEEEARLADLLHTQTQPASTEQGGTTRSPSGPEASKGQGEGGGSPAASGVEEDAANDNYSG
jgi:hypothetical protein